MLPGAEDLQKWLEWFEVEIHSGRSTLENFIRPNKSDLCNMSKDPLGFSLSMETRGILQWAEMQKIESIPADRDKFSYIYNVFICRNSPDLFIAVCTDMGQLNILQFIKNSLKLTLEGSPAQPLELKRTLSQQNYRQVKSQIREVSLNWVKLDPAALSTALDPCKDNLEKLHLANVFLEKSEPSSNCGARGTGVNSYLQAPKLLEFTIKDFWSGTSTARKMVETFVSLFQNSNDEKAEDFKFDPSLLVEPLLSTNSDSIVEIRRKGRVRVKADKQKGILVVSYDRFIFSRRWLSIKDHVMMDSESENGQVALLGFRKSHALDLNFQNFPLNLTKLNLICCDFASTLGLTKFNLRKFKNLKSLIIYSTTSVYSSTTYGEFWRGFQIKFELDFPHILRNCKMLENVVLKNVRLSGNLELELIKSVKSVHLVKCDLENLNNFEVTLTPGQQRKYHKKSDWSQLMLRWDKEWEETKAKGILGNFLWEITDKIPQPQRQQYYYNIFELGLFWENFESWRNA